MCDEYAFFSWKLESTMPGSLISVELDSSHARAYVLDFPSQNAEKRQVVTYCRRVPCAMIGIGNRKFSLWGSVR